MTMASAPGKIILFGEHAVVSGTTALGGAIDLRARATVQSLPGRVLVEINDLSTARLLFGSCHADRSVPPVRHMPPDMYLLSLKELEARDVRVKIESDIPPAAGLGSSASIVVATVAALNGHLGMGLSQKEIASLSYRIEKGVQKGLGSPMDTCSSHIWRLPENCR